MKMLVLEVDDIILKEYINYAKDIVAQGTCTNILCEKCPLRFGSNCIYEDVRVKRANLFLELNKESIGVLN